MKIRVKTSLIEIEIEDDIKLDSANYTKRTLPELPECIESAILQAIKLHNEVDRGVQDKKQRIIDKKTTI